jgi:hypothetical protein
MTICNIPAPTKFARDLFKVGDKVRILCNQSRFKGTTGVVTAVVENVIVKTGNLCDDPVIGHFERASSLELIERKISPEPCNPSKNNFSINWPHGWMHRDSTKEDYVKSIVRVQNNYYTVILSHDTKPILYDYNTLITFYYNKPAPKRKGWKVGAIYTEPTTCYSFSFTYLTKKHAREAYTAYKHCKTYKNATIEEVEID